MSSLPSEFSSILETISTEAKKLNISDLSIENLIMQSLSSSSEKDLIRNMIIMSYLTSLSLFTENSSESAENLKCSLIQQCKLYVSSLSASNPQKERLTDFLYRHENPDTSQNPPPKISEDKSLYSREAVFPSTIATAIKESSPRALFQLTTEIVQQQYPIHLRSLMKKTNQIRQAASSPAQSDSTTSTSILPEFVDFIKVILGVDMIAQYLMNEADPSSLFEAAVKVDPDEDRDDFEESLENVWTDLFSVTQQWIGFTRPAADLLTTEERSSAAYQEYLRLLNPPQSSADSAQPDSEDD